MKVVDVDVGVDDEFVDVDVEVDDDDGDVGIHDDDLTRVGILHRQGPCHHL